VARKVEGLLEQWPTQYYRERYGRLPRWHGQRCARRRLKWRRATSTRAFWRLLCWRTVVPVAARTVKWGGEMAGNRSTTMRDVASLAGVSTATVSHVINGTRFVSDGVKARVGDAIARTGYVSNVLARSLRVGATRTIGHIVTDIENPFFAEVARAVQMKALRHGYVTVIGNSDEDPATERLCVETLIERRIDGLVIAPCGGSVNKSLFVGLAKARIPTVLVNRDIRGARMPLVTVDYRRAGYDATKALLDNGYDRIGVVAGPHAVSSTTERLSGYQHALQGRGLAQDPALIFHGKGKVEDGYNAGNRLLRSAPRPSALLVFNSSMMTGLLASMNELGLSTSDVPAVVFQGRVFDAVWPEVWSVQQPTEQLGTVAFELLLGMMRDGWSEDGACAHDDGAPSRVTAVRAKLYSPRVASPDGTSKTRSAAAG
jgi:LacI family transcriptional regulator, galactose operon repressor